VDGGGLAHQREADRAVAVLIPTVWLFIVPDMEKYWNRNGRRGAVIWKVARSARVLDVGPLSDEPGPSL
jgi:hypothetical protein